MLNIKSIVLYLFSLLFCLLVSFLPPGFAQGHLTVIAGGTLIDGTGREPLPEALIIVEGDKIKTISQKGKASYPPETKIINAEGKFILPGLIDMHVHYADWMPELFLAHGVTSIVDLAGHDWVFAQKEGVAKGKIPGPRVFASSYALGGRLFWNVPFVPIKGPEEAREAARKFIAQGVDLLKAYTEITPEELKVVVEEAQKAGLPVMGHIASLDARQAAELGIDGLAHASGVALATMADPVKVQEMREFETIGISVDYPRYLLYHAFMDPGKADELIHLLVQEEVSLEPDLVNTSARWAAKRREEYKQEDERLLKDPNLRYIPENIGRRALYYEPVEDLTPEEREQLQRGYTNLQNFIRKFVEAGGRVLAGSDAASFVLPGISLHREMELLVEAGLSPMQAVMAATKNNAEFLRQQDIGTVEVGKLADLVIVRDNPLQDIRHTQAIETVIKGGEVIDTSYHPDFRNPIPSPPVPWGYFANPRPVITSLSPMVAAAGEGSVTVVIEGENFLDSSRVEFNKNKVAAKPVGTSQVAGTAYLRHYTRLQVTVPSRLLAQAGTFPVTVTNPQPEGGTSNAGYFIVRFK